MYGDHNTYLIISQYIQILNHYIIYLYILYTYYIIYYNINIYLFLNFKREIIKLDTLRQF